MIAKQNADGTETIISKGHASDADALASIKEPGEYVIYKVLTVTKDDLKKAKENE